MPEIIFKADQGAGVRKIIRIMQGDTRSHVIRFVVPRYDSGVDLAPLVWYIKFVDAEGVPDIALPSAMYEVTADDIRVRWTVNGISTDAAGNTKFQLHGVGKDAEDHVISWTSGAGEIEVTENIGFEVSDEDEEELTALDELIVFVQGELNGVIAAGNNAAASATAANSAAARAEAAAEGAVDATAAAIRANEAAEAAEKAAANANNVMDVKANALAATAEGNPVQIYPDDGSVIKPVLTFEPIQSGSGDPSPTNIRPITGRTGTKLGRCGKNLFDKDSAQQNAFWSYASNSNTTGSAEGYFASELMLVNAGETYTLTNYISSTGVAFVKYWRDTGISGEGIRSGDAVTCDGSKQTYTFTVPANVQYVSITGDMANIDKVQLELGSTASPFEPYQGDTFTLDFGQTIYGGTLDWNKGGLVVGRAIHTMDGTTSGAMLTATSGSRPNFYYAAKAISDALWPSANDTVADMVSSHFKTEAWNRVTEHSTFDEIAMLNNGYVGFAYNGTIDAANAWLAAQHAAGTPVQIAYKLANPITIQLTPQQITALAGLNTVYSSADGMAVNYNKDLAKAFEELKNAIIAMGGNV